MKIAIDCRELRGQAGGFRTYILGLLGGLAEIDADNDYVLYVQAVSDVQHGQVPSRSKAVCVTGGRLWSDWVAMPRHVLADLPDVVHFPCNYGITAVCAPTAITLHDCISFNVRQRCASLKSELLRRYSAFMTTRSVPKADVIVTVSNYSREQISRRFAYCGQVVVAHNGVRTIAGNGNLLTGDKPGMAQPYMLMLASVDPRKNIALAIRAFSLSGLAASGCRLKIVASHRAARRLVEYEARNSGVWEYVDVLTDVDDAYLRRLYSNSAAFVFPSLDEGFGLPPLEAMSCGCPVLSSNVASMPEVLGDAAIYFDPTDPRDLAAKMNAVVAQDALRQHLREAGLVRATGFSWEETARRTLEAYGLAASGCAAVPKVE